MAKERWKNQEYAKSVIENHANMEGANNPMYGKHHTEETKKKISEKAKGRKPSKESRKKMSENSASKRAVYQMDFQGNILHKFDFCKDAAEFVGGNSQNIGFACRNKDRTYKGYKWRYVDDNS